MSSTRMHMYVFAIMYSADDASQFSLAFLDRPFSYQQRWASKEGTAYL